MTGECLPVAGEDVDGFLGDRASDFLQCPFCHPRRSCTLDQQQHAGNLKGPVLTLLGDHAYDRILVNESHALAGALANAGHRVDAPHAPLTTSSRVQQSTLEVRVQLGIELTIVREQYAQRFVRIHGRELDVGAGRGAAGLAEAAVVGSDLQAVGTAHLEQGLVAGLTGDGVAHVEREAQAVARRVEVGEVEGVAARGGRQVAQRGYVHVHALEGGHEEVDAHAVLDHARARLAPRGRLGLEQLALRLEPVQLAVVAHEQPPLAPGW